jgi:uncharacterized protein YbjT (DUF2867 family)
MTTQDPILVLGANGKTGRRVAEGLRARGLAVREGSRSGTPPFDWDDRSTWEPAVRGTSAAYVSFFPDLAVPGSTDAIATLAGLAVEHGLQRVVLLSGRGEEEAQAAERALQESGVAWTVVRCSWFMQNFSEGAFRHGLLEGELALPAGEVLVPFVDVDDIAEVAVAALTEGGHTGRVYELTGPRALTFAEAVAEIGRAAGRELRYVPIPMDAFVAGATAQGVPADIVSLLRYLFTDVLVDDNAGVADGVRQALGRDPRDLAEYASDAAATAVWTRSVAA